MGAVGTAGGWRDGATVPLASSSLIPILNYDTASNLQMQAFDENELESAKTDNKGKITSTFEIYNNCIIIYSALY